MLTHRENTLRNARFQGPEWIPMTVACSNASWDQWREELEAVALRHPDFFLTCTRAGATTTTSTRAGAHKGVPFTDAWGCTWETAVNGLEGVVTNTPGRLGGVRDLPVSRPEPHR